MYPRYIATFDTKDLPCEEYDYIIVGSGVAGMTAALGLAEDACRIALLSKETLSESNTQYAQGGIATAIGPDDSTELHFRDTIKAGAGLCSEEAVRILVEEGPADLFHLIDMGAEFDRNDGFSLTREAAHSRNRILHAQGDATGAEIERTLLCQSKSRERIIDTPFTMAVDLLTDEQGCCGLIAVDATGALKAFIARAVILASGGAGQLYRRTTNPAVSTGDGAAMAFRAGAVLADMEFFQFHPTALYLPRAPMFLISEAVRGEGGILRNVRGERFMPMYHPLAELAPRDVVARAIVNEMDKTSAGYVYLDMRPIGGRIKERFPTICLTCRQFGLDPANDFIPVAPAAHYYMGGIKTDVWGRSTLPGLYACGEAACTMVHGANRLASNSLLEGLVFGNRCVKAVRSDTAGISPRLPRAVCDCGQSDETDVKLLVNDLKRLMWEAAGIIRCREAMTGAGRRLAEMPVTSAGSLDRSALELANMALLGRLIIKAALMRTESRGAHFRLDYPHRSRDGQRHIMLSPEGEEWLNAN